MRASSLDAALAPSGNAMPLIEEIVPAPPPPPPAAEWHPDAMPSAEPVGLTNTERAQMDQLREKYGKHQRARDGGDAPHAESAIAAAQSRADAEMRARPLSTDGDGGGGVSSSSPLARVKICETCRGMKTVKEEYNNRILERMCERCDGEGVLGRDGKPLNPDDDDDDAAPATATRPEKGPSPFAPGSAAETRVRVLEEDVEALEMQVAHYVREMTDATTRLEEDDPERETEEETDLKEFMHQLDLFMQTLRRKIADKKKEIKMVRSTMVKDVDDVEYLRKLRALELSELEREATAALSREPLLDGDGDGAREGEEEAGAGAGGGAANADSDSDSSNEDDEAAPDLDEPDP